MMLLRIADMSATSATVRWEKKVETYEAFLALACAQLIFSKVDRVSG
jgi:hypothetical protein